MKKFLKASGAHILNWLDIYFWVPLFLLGIIGAIKYAHFITGRPPASPESVDWLIEFAYRLVACIFVIVMVSVAREQTGIWMTKDEQKANIALAAIEGFTKCFFAALFTYILLH